MWGVKVPPVDSADAPPSQSKPFDVDQSALSIPRATSQVLKTVYRGGTHSGGFYPNGLNGTTK